MLPFSWRTHQEKALAKALYRSIHLARTNPDYQRKFPSEVRDNPDRKVLFEAHPEAEKRILHDFKIKQKFSETPTVERPTRKNRHE